jgi:hypothetical protein
MLPGATAAGAKLANEPFVKSSFGKSLRARDLEDKPPIRVGDRNGIE